MASAPADPSEILRSSTEKNNYTRLTRLLIEGGTVILRELLDIIIPPHHFAHVLMFPIVLGRLEWLRDRHIITSEQWKSLFPTDTSCGKSTDFDITLLFKLLREFCSLTSPPNGWDKLPDDTDLALPADLARIKYYRNAVYAHRVKTELDDSEFQDLWKRIKDALLRIVKHYDSSAVLDWEIAIKKLLKDPLDIQKSHEENEKLKIWCIDDPGVPQTLPDLRDENAKLKNQETRLESSLVNVHCTWRSITQEVTADGVGTFLILHYKDDPLSLISMIRDDALPDGLVVKYIVAGSIVLQLTSTSDEALNELLARYQSGQLKEDLEKVFMTEEVKTLFGGQDVEFSVEICEEEIENAHRVLISAVEADDNFISEFRMSTQEECEDKNTYKTLEDAHLKKQEYDDAISYSTKCLAIAQESGNKVAEMNAYMMLGDAHLKKEEYDDVISYSKKCLAMAQESGDKVAEMNAYMMLQNVHLMKGEYDNAILYSKKCLPIAQESGDKVAEMNAYMMIGNAHLKKIEYDDSILYSTKYLAMAQESGDKVAEMNAYIMLGNAHLMKGEFDDAILYSNRCLAIAQESGHKVAKMNAYMMIGNVHLKKEEYDDAISYSTKCLAMAQESGDKVAEVNAYMTLGNAHLMNEEYDDAISYGTKCLAMAQESGDEVAEMNALILLGDAHLMKGEFDDAILYSNRCLAIAQESGHKVAKMNAYMILGNAHLKKEEYDDAISYSNKCLAIAQESGDEVAEMKALILLGNAHLDKEEYDDAHSHFTEGMTIARQLEDNHKVTYFGIRINGIYEMVGVSEGHSELLSLKPYLKKLPDDVQKSFFHLFFDYVCYKENGKYEEAISCLETCMAFGKNIINKVEYRGLLWVCKHAISELHVLAGDYDKGIQYQQEALDDARKQGSRSKQAKSHFSLGKVYYKLKQFENAEKSLKDSLTCYELIFVGLKENDRFKIAFVDKYKETFKLLLKVLIERNKKEEALVLSDHYRAKALKDLLVSSYGMKKEQTADEGLQYADVHSLVSSRNYTLLFYSTCFEELYTFVVEAGNELGFSVQHFEYCDSCLDKLVDKTFDDMKVFQVWQCENRSLDSSESSYESRLTSGLEILYNKLINNIKCLIKQDEIVIIPEGPLCRLPFAALRDPDTGQYLSETKRIRMAPSIASLKLFQEYPVEHRSRKEALIIGANVVDPVMLYGVEKVFDFLDGVIEEADEIATMLGVQPLLSSEATKPVVIKRLQEGASVVHIAACGMPSKAAIVLAPSPEITATKIPDEEDYILTMADVHQAQVRAQLVVLSCCHSGRGEIKAEGVVGMCRAFLASGARAVLGSLWAIDDHATCQFMVKFYQYLKEGKSASASLHLTMNDMRRTPQYSEPKYWAPFFLMGDDVTIQFKD